MSLIPASLLIFTRQMRLSLRSPAWPIIGLFQPALYLAFLGPLLVRVAGAGVDGLPAGAAWRFFVPGLLIQLGLFGPLFAGLSIIADLRSGVFERMRVTPVSRFALLAGRVMRDTVVLLVQTAVLLAVAYAFGLRAPVAGLLLMFLFVAAIAVGLSALSHGLGLLVRQEESFTPLLNAAAIPLLLLSGVLLPMTLAPQWLDILSRLTPFRYVIDGMRSALYGDYGSSAVAVGAGVALATAACCLALGARLFARRNA
ncbi:ABC transporter permease [Microbispora hainanensis]|uniref:ABC transporter permease n=1 Tax=Microbispora TaxID=2005 RepID=UPI00115AE0FA|nr:MULTISPECIES: ABC transporter permease [Microbispora]NJP26128.1 ABC transporter permease [Microbispora sp. CL1-1]TQS12563.1 ABC transporter permease [Microbispora sp. SCL1-1]